MKRMLFLLCILFAIVVLFPSCQKGKNEITKKVRLAEKFEVIENKNTPQSASINLIFEEDLSITEEEWWPWELILNEDNIYVFTGKENLLKKFNHEGIEVSNKEFPEGQGPGEFQQIDSCFSSNGLLFIADFSQRKLTVIDKEFEIHNISKLDFWGQVFRLDSKGNLYFLTIKLLPETTSKNRVILTKYSTSGRVLYEIDEYLWGTTYDKVKRKYLDELFRSQLKYKIPKYMPYIADLFIFDNDYLLVVTFENDIDETTLAGDLYDDKGVYRARIQVPKYYRWDFLLAPNKNYAISKSNYFYTLEADKYEETFYVKRYKMIWVKPH